MLWGRCMNLQLNDRVIDRWGHTGRVIGFTSNPAQGKSTTCVLYDDHTIGMFGQAYIDPEYVGLRLVEVTQ